MLTGVGCDLIEIERMKKACEKEAFLLRVYTEEERRQADGRISVLAGTFAVKEAVAKVLGTGFRTFMPKDVEVLRDELGKPYVVLYGNAEKIACEKQIKRIEVSISDTAQYAMAFALGEERISDSSWENTFPRGMTPSLSRQQGTTVPSHRMPK